ncbi:hypothetical protein [Calidifontibacillus erzurumensis]|uniref:Uncharacterized protein n=2 Tax=Calidifontibacillus erzurumensis TaxID=2741433 RepID=A0A8J8GBP3_9BACI|nr:hypothetical protein [Calidifontibacillus erzurumensis]NSL50854.1 hypothetical protein [Calidifontibacillus erzurumensis]
MKKWKSFIFTTLISITIFIGLSFIAQPIIADKYRYDEHLTEHVYEHKKEDAIEEGGELLGWGAVIAVAGAGIILPLRRSSRSLMTKFPNTKKLLQSALKLFGKTHIFIGALAITLSVVHGLIMFVHEEEFGFREVAGTTSIGLMSIAAIFGLFLS